MESLTNILSLQHDNYFYFGVNSIHRHIHSLIWSLWWLLWWQVDSYLVQNTVSIIRSKFFAGHFILYKRLRLLVCLLRFLIFACSVTSVMCLCDPVDCSPPGSFVLGIVQARILEWTAMPSSRRSSHPRDPTCGSCDSCIAGGFFTLLPKMSIVISGPWQKVLDFEFCLKQPLRHLLHDLLNNTTFQFVKNFIYMLERVWRKGTLLHCWCECKLVQPLWRTVWRFL